MAKLDKKQGYHRVPDQTITPPLSDGLVGIHHKLVNRCALEEWANKKKKVLGQC
jgi:hypothetical protein